MLQFMYRSSRPLDKGGPSLPPKFFWSFGPQFGLKIRGDGRSGTLRPSLDPATATSNKQISMIFQGQITVFKD